MIRSESQSQDQDMHEYHISFFHRIKDNFGVISERVLEFLNNFHGHVEFLKNSSFRNLHKPMITGGGLTADFFNYFFHTLFGKIRALIIILAG